MSESAYVFDIALFPAAARIPDTEFQRRVGEIRGIFDALALPRHICDRVTFEHVVDAERHWLAVTLPPRRQGELMLTPTETPLSPRGAGHADDMREALALNAAWESVYAILGQLSAKRRVTPSTVRALLDEVINPTLATRLVAALRRHPIVRRERSDRYAEESLELPSMASYLTLSQEVRVRARVHAVGRNFAQIKSAKFVDAAGDWTTKVGRDGRCSIYWYGDDRVRGDAFFAAAQNNVYIECSARKTVDAIDGSLKRLELNAIAGMLRECDCPSPQIGADV